MAGLRCLSGATITAGGTSGRRPRMPDPAAGARFWRETSLLTHSRSQAMLMVDSSFSQSAATTASFTMHGRWHRATAGIGRRCSAVNRRSRRTNASTASTNPGPRTPPASPPMRSRRSGTRTRPRRCARNTASNDRSGSIATEMGYPRDVRVAPVSDRTKDIAGCREK
jgi:hypothetical protein